MYISKKTSYVIAALIIFLFFASGFIFFQFRPDNYTSTTDIVEKKLEEESTEIDQSSLPSNDENEAKADSAQESFTLSDFHRSETKDGKLLWEIKGENAEYHPSDQSVDIKSCLFSMRSDSDKLITLEAGEAKVFLQGASLNLAEFSDNVVLHYDSDMKILTSQASYNRENALVTSNSHVQIVGEWYTIEGDGLEAHMNSKIYKISSSVRSTFEPNKRSKKKS